MELSIIIPCYNEEKNIPLILFRFAEVIPQSDVEVILVNNGSNDNSAEVLNDLVPSYPFARIVTVKKNQGYGFGILSGLNAAIGNYLGWTHADMQTDPYDSIKAFEIIKQQGKPRKIFIKGSRKGRSFVDSFFTMGMSVFESIYTHTCLWDINAQPTIFHHSFYKTWKSPPHDFSLDLYALYMAKRAGLCLERFPVVFPERVHGVSSWNTGFAQKWRFIRRTIKFSFELKKKIR